MTPYIPPEKLLREIIICRETGKLFCVTLVVYLIEHIGTNYRQTVSNYTLKEEINKFNNSSSYNIYTLYVTAVDYTRFVKKIDAKHIYYLK